jgi:hypothetical protein
MTFVIALMKDVARLNKATMSVEMGAEFGSCSLASSFAKSLRRMRSASSELSASSYYRVGISIKVPSVNTVYY